MLQLHLSIIRGTTTNNSISSLADNLAQDLDRVTMGYLKFAPPVYRVVLHNKYGKRFGGLHCLNQSNIFVRQLNCILCARHGLTFQVF